MEGQEDGRLDPIRSFSLSSFRLGPEVWTEFTSDEDNVVTLNNFCSSQDFSHLFLYWDRDQDQDPGQNSRICVTLDFPPGVASKVLSVSKRSREAVTKENARNILSIQEVDGGDALSCSIALSEVTCALLSDPETSSRWAPGVAEEAVRFMKRQRNEAQVMKAQVDGLTFLPQPDSVSPEGLNDDGGQHLVHTCDGVIVEWAELVSEFLQQDWSRPVLEGLKPTPSEEFNFWWIRLRNLDFIQQQLMSPSAQLVASIVQTGDSVYWSTLRDIYRDVQEALQEAEDVTRNLRPVQDKLKDIQHMEFHQLRDNMAAVMEEVRLLWVRSQFYCSPCRMVVLLQEICNLFIQMSRGFLRGQEVMRGLVSEPRLVLDQIRLVIRTLQTLKEVYAQNQTLLDQSVKQQDSGSPGWDFPSHLVFLHLDHFLRRLHTIQEVFRITLQLEQLDQAVLSGVGGGMWTDLVQEVYQDFLVHVRLLSECSSDPTDPEDQSFQLHLDQFQSQVSHMETQLVSVLSRALEDCSRPWSGAKLVKMFRFVLDRARVRDQLRPQLSRLVTLVLKDLDQAEQVFHHHRDRSRTFGRFCPMAAARLIWTQQVQRRTEEALESYRTIQDLCLDSPEAQLVQQRVQQVEDVLQDFRDSVRSNWSSQLDSDSGFILKHPLVQIRESDLLEVSCSLKVEAVLRGLRYASRDQNMDLQPHTAGLFRTREDVRKIHLHLGHMVSCYNQVVSDVLPVELPLIQDQLQHLNQTMSQLQRRTWGCEGLQLLVQQTQKVLDVHAMVREARANMAAMTQLIQGWAELQLLQLSADWLLEGTSEETCSRIRADGQELLRLTQVNRSLYRADVSSEMWTSYVDYMDAEVQDGLHQLIFRELHFLSDHMNPQTSSSALLTISLQLKETGSVFEPSVGVGLSDFLKTIISDVYAAANQLPRISTSHHGNYQVSLQLDPELSALEHEVMHHLQKVEEEAEHLRAGLDRYSHLWQSDRTTAFQEFLSYSRQLGPEEVEPEQAPPTLKDFQREIESLHRLSAEVTHLDDVIVLHGWLQVDLRPFRDALLSVIDGWKHMYTDHLLSSVSHSLQQVTQRDADDDEAASSSRFPLTQTILLLEAAAVELPEHLAAQLQVVTSL
ncbi:dynein axonemal heavy chain 17-like isoform X2 [Mugil cephalus]|uniref:dynein axonemal heavy chain 17-like isoform X2 n=1 Tax=Mugil cephalus TaxID=48193 RepID=UPI001FB80694|nr:dynein axonemal heavy chain 17-like isoform X2 [Mugil cephalus]